MTKESYQNLKQELEEVLRKLESSELEVDEALKLHQKGKKLVTKLEKYLQDASHSVSQSDKDKK